MVETTWVEVSEKVAARDAVGQVEWRTRDFRPSIAPLAQTLVVIWLASSLVVSACRVYSGLEPDWGTVIGALFAAIVLLPLAYCRIAGAAPLCISEDAIFVPVVPEGKESRLTLMLARKVERVSVDRHGVLRCLVNGPNGARWRTLGKSEELVSLIGVQESCSYPELLSSIATCAGENKGL